jgi:AcrR family transcriptional regulator
LVRERGYDKVTVEDIAARADLAKGTFYLHYENKETLLFGAFSRLVAGEVERTAYRDGPWTEVRQSAVRSAYEHAQEMPDLYKVCLSDARTRSRYLEIVAQYVEENIEQRAAALHRQPRLPVQLIATAFAGAQVAILESWLDGKIAGRPEEMAAMQLDLIVAGMAWASNISLSEVGYDPAPTETGRA